MARNCLFCDGKKKVVRFGKKHSCPYCLPPPGAIVSKISDRYETITHYGANGKVLREDKVDLWKGEFANEVVNNQVRVQHKKAKQKPQRKAERRTDESVTRKRSR